jgi:carbon-monoxide dehydrogenase medium subunit
LIALTSSWPAQAGHPVITGGENTAQTVDTGSSAFADDDEIIGREAAEALAAATSITDDDAKKRDGGEEAVKPAPFDYAKARSVEHAIELLGRDGARVLAGGQSLIATLNMRLSSPSLLVDINAVPGLDGIARRNGHLEIGALVRHAQAERSPQVGAAAPLIARALPHIGHPAIRNRGTIGGSIAFADPAAELPACLVALDGEIEVSGPAGARSVGADDFFKDLFETALGPGDVLTAIRVPAARADTRVGFAELARRHGDYAMVGLAAAARADGENLADVRLVFFAVGSTPVRAHSAEAALATGDVEAAVAALDRDLDPPDDVQAEDSVKKHLAGVLLRRVARQLMEPA